jgi:hypothetical protein
MSDALSFVKFAKTFAHPRHKIDALLDVLPRCIFGELVNGLYSYFLDAHVFNPTERAVNKFVPRPPLWFQPSPFFKASVCPRMSPGPSQVWPFAESVAYGPWSHRRLYEQEAQN